MKHSTTAPTKSEQARFDKLHDLGCIACRLNGFTHPTVAEIHHFLRGNKRIGHAATVPLCGWHHRAAFDGTNEATMLALMGPSFHRHTREFRARYGDDAVLLARVNALIDNNGEQQ